MRLPALHLAVALALGTLLGCEGDGAPTPGGAAGAESADSPGAGPGSGFERALVFAGPGSDDRLMVPWILEAATRPGGVDRIHRGWLVREGEWEPFYRNAWSLPPLREPWRILPDGPFRILVGEGDRLDRVVFDGEGRRLQLILDEPLAEWTDGRGGSFQLLDGALVLGDRRIDGRILDVSQGLRPSEPDLGDWMLLTSEEGWSVVLAASTEAGEASEYRLWAHRPGGDEEDPVSGVTVTWSETRTFEPARRPIPEVLTVAAPDGSVSGRLEVTALQVETREGEGPLLPLDGWIGVEGEIGWGDRPPLEVHGILRHRRR